MTVDISHTAPGTVITYFFYFANNISDSPDTLVVQVQDLVNDKGVEVIQVRLVRSLQRRTQGFEEAETKSIRRIQTEYNSSPE